MSVLWHWNIGLGTTSVDDGHAPDRKVGAKLGGEAVLEVARINCAASRAIGIGIRLTDKFVLVNSWWTSTSGDGRATTASSTTPRAIAAQGEEVGDVWCRHCESGWIIRTDKALQRNKGL